MALQRGLVVHRNSIGTLEAVEGEGLPAFRALLGNAPFRFWLFPVNCNAWVSLSTHLGSDSGRGVGWTDSGRITGKQETILLERKLVLQTLDGDNWRNHGSAA